MNALPSEVQRLLEALIDQLGEGGGEDITDYCDAAVFIRDTVEHVRDAFPTSPLADAALCYMNDWIAGWLIGTVEEPV